MEADKNPYAALLGQLSGIKPAPIRARQGWQQYMHERLESEIEPAVNQAWAKVVARGITEKDHNDAGFRADVCRRLFNNLPKSEQDVWKDKAQQHKQKLQDEYKKSVKESFSSKSPEQRQR